ncbi:MAG: hypothetical protein KDD58_01165 [Bdellovibrionales bacterium]|nr:hypothetical protein [Bdellovibrionales bacterium]
MIQKSDKLIVLILLSLFALSCEKEFNPEHNISYKVEPPTRSDKDVKAPEKLIYEIEELFLKHYRQVKPESDISDAKLLVTVPRKYLGFDVYLQPKESHLAFLESHHIPFPRGGGYIDLAPIVEGEKGSFYLNMIFNWKEMGLESSDLDLLKVYFMSNSKRRLLNGKNWGGGCNKFYEITHFFKEKIMKKGLLLNATDQRYLSTLAGTFYFVLLKAGDLYMATATFEDSRYKDLLCRI